MPVVELAVGVLDDFDRIFDHVAKWDVEAAPSRILEIRKALEILQTSPMIGRPARGGKRELVIGKGTHGYIAQYRYLERAELVVVLHIRSQREAGYKATVGPTLEGAALKAAKVRSRRPPRP